MSCLGVKVGGIRAPTKPSYPSSLHSLALFFLCGSPEALTPPCCQTLSMDGIHPPRLKQGAEAGGYVPAGANQHWPRNPDPFVLEGRSEFMGSVAATSWGPLLCPSLFHGEHSVRSSNPEEQSQRGVPTLARGLLGFGVQKTGDLRTAFKEREGFRFSPTIFSKAPSARHRNMWPSLYGAARAKSV